MAYYNGTTNNLVFQITGSEVLSLSSSGVPTVKANCIIPEIKTEETINFVNPTSILDPTNGFYYDWNVKLILLNRNNSNIKGVGVGYGQRANGPAVGNPNIVYVSREFGFVNSGFNVAYSYPSHYNTFGNTILSHISQPNIPATIHTDYNVFINGPKNLSGFGFVNQFHNDIARVGIDGAYTKGIVVNNINRSVQVFAGPTLTNLFSIGTNGGTGNIKVCISGNMFITGSTGVGMNNYATNESKLQVSGNLLPYSTANSFMDLGGDGYFWNDVWATDDSINTSDKDVKKEIKDSNLGLKFVNQLKPVKYRYKNGSRIHYGLIAQEVKEVLDKNNIDTADFAGYVDGKNSLKFLRYEEFLSPLIKAIQELSAKIESLEAEVLRRGL